MILPIVSVRQNLNSVETKRLNNKLSELTYDNCIPSSKSKLSGNFLNVYFTGKALSVKAKSTPLIPIEVVDFCKKYGYDFAGTTSLPNKSKGGIREDAYFIIKGPVNCETSLFAQDKKEAKNLSGLKDYIDYIVEGPIDSSEGYARILVINKEGKAIGFNENILSRSDYSDSIQKGYLYGRRSANFTSPRFKELDPNCFRGIRSDVKDFEYLIATDEYGELGEKSHISRVFLSERTGLGGRMELHSLDDSLKFHRFFGFIDSKKAYNYLYLPQERNGTLTPGKYVINELLEMFKTNPVLLDNPIHYSELKPKSLVDLGRSVLKKCV